MLTQESKELVTSLLKNRAGDGHRRRYRQSQGDGMIMEDKQKICDKLLEALQLTRQYEDLQSLIHLRKGVDQETVTALFAQGNAKEINVSMDSGSAMIRDILRALV